MKTQKFSSTEVRRNAPAVWNAVQENGKAEIHHRDRTNMIVVRKDIYEQMTKEAKGHESKED